MNLEYENILEASVQYSILRQGRFFLLMTIWFALLIFCVICGPSKGVPSDFPTDQGGQGAQGDSPVDETRPAYDVDEAKGTKVGEKERKPEPLEIIKRGHLSIKGLKKKSQVLLKDKFLGNYVPHFSPQAPYEVIKDNRPLDKTKLRLGLYTVIIHHPEYLTITHQIKITADATEELHIKDDEWKPKSGKPKSIKFKSRKLVLRWMPPGAKVTIGGKEFRYHEACQEGLPYEVYGTYPITASHPDYDEMPERKLEVDRVAPHHTYALIYYKEDWKKKKGWLSIKSLKEGSQVYVLKKERRRHRPVTSFHPYEVPAKKTSLSEPLEAGEYYLEIKHPQYHAIEIGYVEIRKDKDQQIDLEGRWKPKTGKIKIGLPGFQPEKTQVWIDDKEMAYDEFAGKDIPLPFGSYTLELRHPAYDPIKKFPVEIFDARINSVRPRWVSKTAILIVDTKDVPDKARFSIDKKPVGLSKLKHGYFLPLGTHTLRITHPKYHPFEKNFTIKWKDEKLLTPPVMRPRLGTLVISDFKIGTKVYIDNIDRTNDFRENKMDMLIGPHDVRISHWQYNDFGYPGVTIREGQPLTIASAGDWKGYERKGSIIFNVIKPDSRVFIDGKEIRHAKAGKPYPRIIGKHTYKIMNPLYPDTIQGQIDLKTEKPKHIALEKDWKLRSVNLNVRGFDTVEYSDAEDAEIKGTNLSARPIKGKEVYVFFLRKSGGRDPIEDFQCFLLPLGLPGTLVWKPGFTLSADSEVVTIEAGSRVSREKVFLYDENGVNIDSFSLPKKIKPSRKGVYRLEWGRQKRNFEVPYSSYLFLGGQNLDQLGRDLLERERKPLVAFHFYKLKGDKQNMQKAWFRYCENKTLETLQNNHIDRKRLKKIYSQWDRVQFHDDLQPIVSKYKTKINRLIAR